MIMIGAIAGLGAEGSNGMWLQHPLGFYRMRVNFSIGQFIFTDLFCIISTALYAITFIGGADRWWSHYVRLLILAT